MCIKVFGQKTSNIYSLPTLRCLGWIFFLFQNQKTGGTADQIYACLCMYKNVTFRNPEKWMTSLNIDQEKCLCRGLRSVQKKVFHQIMEIRDRKDLSDNPGYSHGTEIQESRKRNKQTKKSIKAMKCLLWNVYFFRHHSANRSPATATAHYVVWNPSKLI